MSGKQQSSQNIASTADDISSIDKTSNITPVPRSFWHLFIGTVTSHLGTNISILVLPTYAIMHLRASDQEVAAISIAQAIPMVIFSLWIGSRVDRFDRKRLIIIADIFSALLSFLCAYWLFQNGLSLPKLYLIVFVLALLSIVYNVATQALVPELLCQDRTLWGNSWLYAGRSMATVIGQFIASKLTVVAFGAVAMTLDAISHLVRAIVLLPILERSTARKKITNQQQGWIRDTQDALRYIKNKKELIRVIGAVASFNFGGSFILAFFFLYTYNTLGLTPYHLGIAFAIGSISATAGALLASRWSHSENIVRRAQRFFILACFSLWLLLLATQIHPFIILLIYEIIFKFSSAVFSIIMTTRRHHIVAPNFQGRVSSVGILASNVAILLAAVIATFSAGILTPTQGVLVGCLFSLTTLFWFVNWHGTSPIAEQSEFPTSETDDIDNTEPAEFLKKR